MLYLLEVTRFVGDYKRRQGRSLSVGLVEGKKRLILPVGVSNVGGSARESLLVLHATGSQYDTRMWLAGEKSEATRRFAGASEVLGCRRIPSALGSRDAGEWFLDLSSRRKSVSEPMLPETLDDHLDGYPV